MAKRTRKHSLILYLNDDEKYILDTKYKLSRIGNSLNQIARRMNATGHVYAEDLKEIKEMMNQVWHTQKSMLSRQPSIKQ